MGSDSMPEIIERIAILLAASFHNCQDAFDETTSSIRMSSVRDTAPDDGFAQSTFSTVIGWFDDGKSQIR